MAVHTYFGKQRLCYTEVSDFTDFQGIGHDPMYKRYDSVFSVIQRAIPTSLHHFLATPEYLADEDRICWHIENWNERPIKLSELYDSEHKKYKSILDDTVRIYKSSIFDLNGEDLHIMAGAIKYIDEERVYCCDDKVYLVAWGMTPDIRKHKVIGSVIQEYECIKKFVISFDAGEHGKLSKIDKSINRVEGSVLSDTDMPDVSVDDDWKFIGWSPSPNGVVVNSDLSFVAQYNKIDRVVSPPVPPIPEPSLEYYDCTFDPGAHGRLNGSQIVCKEANTTLCDNDIPSIIPNKGYRFIGWSVNPNGMPIDGNKVFTARYEKVVPWYRRWWLWLTGLFTAKGCLKWLLGILLVILLVWLLSWLLRSCGGCEGDKDSVNGVSPIDSITRDDGRVVDDNGYVRPVTDDDGVLPDDESIVAPVMGEGGDDPSIVEQPGMPSIIANRLFLFMENEDGDIDALARDFKKKYPGDKYKIIGFDKEVKLLVIQIPEQERDQIRRTINGKLSNHDFIVFDEEVYEIRGQQTNSSKDIGWHLDAIHLKQGWSYTMGSPDIRIAIVDDGIQASHPMFKGRIVDAYNVFTQNNSLSTGSGHGTHTAGLAAGSSEYYSKGAAGVAPNCKIMPIQVFDNSHCPLSAIVAGVMYALHHDADVINVSIGPSFKGLNVLPVEQQNEIARSQFHNVAALWSKVSRIAANKKSILVFAAGNDDILTSIPPENRNESSIVVTAVDKRMYPTEFTNYGPCSDISAPGKDIYSSYPSNTFQSCDGTSMSAPIVSGTVALMKSLKKDLTVEQVRNVLFSTGADVYGWIPPMVLVDKVLDATKRGDFRRIEREGRSVPDADNSYNSGQVPVGGDNSTIVENPQPVQPNSGNETDYDAIRRKIAEYKRKIAELEKLLPNNK